VHPEGLQETGLQPEELLASPRPHKLGTALQHLWDPTGPRAGGCFPEAWTGGLHASSRPQIALAWHEQQELAWWCSSHSSVEGLFIFKSPGGKQAGCWE